MPDQPITQPWTPERIREVMATEHGVTWEAPTPEETWKEDAVDRLDQLDTADSPDEWLIVDPATHELRALTPDELFDLTDAVAASDPGLADVPRDHPRTERETTYLQDAMKEHGVPAEVRAQSRWEQRLDSMARHPSMQPALPVRPQIQ